MAATYSKPASIPRWADTGTIVEPSEAQKDSGWTFEQVPPSSFENWKSNLIGDWVKWLDERFDDGGTEDVLLIRHPGDGNITIETHDDGVIIPGGIALGGATIPSTGGNIRLGDNNFQIEYGGLTGSQKITFDGGPDEFYYDRNADSFFWDIAGTTHAKLTSSGLILENGLYVGSASGSPLADSVVVEGGLRVGGGYTATPGLGDGIFAGGIAVGFDANPVNNRVAVGDAAFNLNYSSATDVRLGVDASDYLRYDRSSDAYEFVIATTPEVTIDALGMQVRNGLVVGFVGSPVDNEVRVGDINFKLDYQSSTDVRIVFDASNDYMRYDRTNDKFLYAIGNTAQVGIVSTGIQVRHGIVVGDINGTIFDFSFYAPAGGINCGGFTNPGNGGGVFSSGLIVGFDGTPTTDAVHVGDADLGIELISSTLTSVKFGPTDRINFDRTNNIFEVSINGTAEAHFLPTGVRIANGLIIGNVTGTPLDNDIIVEGGINCGGSVNPTPGDIIATSGAVFGFDGNVADQSVKIGDDNFRLDWVDANTVRMNLAATDWFEYDRSTDTYEFKTASTDRFRIEPTGVEANEYRFINNQTVHVRISGNHAMPNGSYSTTPLAGKADGIEFDNGSGCFIPIPSAPGWIIEGIAFYALMLGTGGGASTTWELFRAEAPEPTITGGVGPIVATLTGTSIASISSTSDNDGWFIMSSSVAGIPHTMQDDSTYFVEVTTNRTGGPTVSQHQILIEFTMPKPIGSGDDWSL